MNSKIYFVLFFITMFGLQFNASAQLKSTQRVYPFVNVNDIVTTIDNVMIAKDGVGQWWIGDGDPNSAINNTQYIINKGDAAPYDDAYNNYAVETVGHRKTDDETNVNSFMLWSPTDSGVPWNYINSKVKFDIKILDEEDWTHNNNASYQFGIYFWVAVQHGWDSGPDQAWVCFQQGPYLKSLWEEGDPYRWWGDYFYTGLGEDLADGKWHSFEIDLIKVMENQKQFDIDAGVTDPYLIGSDPDSPDYKDPSEGVHWKWFGVLGMEIYGLHVMVGNVEVVGSSATKIKYNPIESRLKVYPNPSSGIVNINLNDLGKSASLRIYNITGQLVKRVNNIASHTRLNLSDLTKGSYFIRVNDGTNFVTQKINILK